MQKQNVTFGEAFQALLALCYFCFLIAVFTLCVYAFWQNGLFSSFLSSIGYVVLAILITGLVNGVFITVYFVYRFFSRLIDTAVDFAFPTNNTKAAK